MDHLSERAAHTFAVIQLVFVALWLLPIAIWAWRFRRTGWRPRGIGGWLLAVPLAVVAAFGLYATGKVVQSRLKLARGEQGADPYVGQPAPTLNFTTLDAEPRHLGGAPGPVILVNVWGTWCTPCVEELPDLALLHTKLEPRGLRVVALSDEPASTVRGWLAEHPHALEVGVLPSLEGLPAPWSTAQHNRPTTFLLARDGTLARYFLGQHTAAELEAAIIPLL